MFAFSLSTINQSYTSQLQYTNTSFRETTAGGGETNVCQQHSHTYVTQYHPLFPLLIAFCLLPLH